MVNFVTYGMQKFKQFKQTINYSNNKKSNLLTFLSKEAIAVGIRANTHLINFQVISGLVQSFSRLVAFLKSTIPDKRWCFLTPIV